MAFEQPNYNLTCNIWTLGANPATDPPRVAGARCNLAWGKRVSSFSTGGTGSEGILVSAMTLLLESTTDIRGRDSATQEDIVEVPSNSGRYYFVHTADYIGFGFPNEHKGAVIVQRSPFKTPDVH